MKSAIVCNFPHCTHTQLGTVETEIRSAKEGQNFMGAPKGGMMGMMAPCPPPPSSSRVQMLSAVRGAVRGAMDNECDDEDAFSGRMEMHSRRGGGGGGGGGGGSFARSKSRISVTTGHPRVEHLASAAVFSSSIPVDSSGTTAIDFPQDFDGVAFVMLSSDCCCEWRITPFKSSSSSSLSSLLQRQLCLTEPFSPQSHMALQVRFCSMSCYTN